MSGGEVTVRSEQRCFGGVQGFYELTSTACGGPMRFAVFLPPQALVPSTATKLPVLYYLAGLTCTEETFVIKAGAQRVAAELGVVIVTCDTSPRSVRVDGDDASWDFGQGAGFYLDATAVPWSTAYRMETFVTQELREAVENRFPVVDGSRRGIFGHSMGGHGALVLALRHPDLYRSVSAFAPIVSPSTVPWGQKAFSGYLGDDVSSWRGYDTCALLADGKVFASTPLVDQGLDDKFLAVQLQPERLEEAAKAAGHAVEVRRHAGYDHSYYFIQTLVGDHLRHHLAKLG